MSGRDLIAIVDAQDNVIGSEERKIARQKGLPHRMVKVVLFNPQGQILIQQRNELKEDSPLKWDISATGHVDGGEDYLEAALRETQEEVGITDAALTFIGKYYYERPKDNLILRRFNGIFTGKTLQSPVLDPSEVAQIQWIAPDDLIKWFKSHPKDFVVSCLEIFDQFGPAILSKNPYRETVDHSASN